MHHRGSDGRQAPRLGKPSSGGICCRMNSKSLAICYAVWPSFFLFGGNRAHKRRVYLRVPATSKLACSQRNRLVNTHQRCLSIPNVLYPAVISGVSPWLRFPASDRRCLAGKFRITRFATEQQMQSVIPFGLGLNRTGPRWFSDGVPRGFPSGKAIFSTSKSCAKPRFM